MPSAPSSATYDVAVEFVCTIDAIDFDDKIDDQSYFVNSAPLTTESFTMINTPGCSMANMDYTYEEKDGLDTSSFLTFNQAT